MKSQTQTSTVLNILLWIAQCFLAAVLIWAGLMKLFYPAALPFPWATENPGLVIVTGLVDLSAGVGLILPGIFRVKRYLTVLAAYGVIVLMIAAIIFHIGRNEAKDIGFNIFMLIMAVFVAWGRRAGLRRQVKHCDR